MKKFATPLLIVSLLGSVVATPAYADAAKPGQSMTHIKTDKGIASTLEGAGVVLYVQGGATAAVMGDSIASTDAQYVLHIPVTGSKKGVEHTGSNIVFFNTATNKQVQLKNPLIDLKSGTVNAVVAQATSQSIPVLTITNLSEVKAKVSSDQKSKLRTTSYDGVKLSLAPGVAATLASLLGLPEGSLPDELAFASAGVSLYSSIKAKK